MIRSRLSAVLLASLFLLHLAMAGGGFASGMSGGSGMDAGEMAMAMPEMDMASTADASSLPSSGDEMPCPDAAPCPVPGMPTHCPMMAPCAAVIAAPVPVEVALALPLAALRPTAAVPGVPHTRTSPPELPPPRV